MRTSWRPSTPSQYARKLTRGASFLRCVLHSTQPSNKFNTGIIYNVKCIQTQLISSQALLWAAAGKVQLLTAGKLCLSTVLALGNAAWKVTSLWPHKISEWFTFSDLLGEHCKFCLLHSAFQRVKRYEQLPSEGPDLKVLRMCHIHHSLSTFSVYIP